MADIQRIWNKEEIRDNLQNDNHWLVRGVVAVYEYQTADEQVSEETRESNGIGFNAVDAGIMSSFAKQIKKWDPVKFNSPLSPKQLVIARKKMIKYSGQLARIANGEV